LKGKGVWDLIKETEDEEKLKLLMEEVC